MTDFNAVSRLIQYQFQMLIAIHSNMCTMLQQKWLCCGTITIRTFVFLWLGANFCTQS